MGMMPEEIEKQFGVTTASEFEEQMSEKITRTFICNK